MGIFTRDVAPETTAKVLPFNAPRPIRASAQRVKLGEPKDVEQIRRRSEVVWQRRAWEYFDIVAEIGFAFGLLGNVTSRARLYPAYVIDRHQPPVELNDVDELPPEFVELCDAAMDRVTSAKGGQAALLRDAALNLAVAGECYLVQTPERIGTGEPESWDIKSVDEVVVAPDGKVRLKSRPDARQQDHVDLPTSAFVGRIWRSHPRWSDSAHSSMIGVLQPCEDLLLFSHAARATARSRLNAGAIFIPDGLSAAAMPAEPDPSLMLTEPESEPPIEDHDEFEEELIEAMTTPIIDQDSAAAVVPLLIRGPAELGEKIKQFKFERSFDPALAERADRALDRIMQGIDVPKDIVTGLANVKYSNAIAIDKSLYKAHVEPLLLMLCDAFTSVYLRPALEAMGADPDLIAKTTIWYDPTDIVIQSDPETMADNGFDRNLISAAAWRRSHGFTEEDRPEPDEMVRRMIVEKGVLSPELTEAILTQIAPELFGQVRAAHQEQSGSPIPPEVQQALGVPPSEAPAAPAEPPAGAGTPAAPPGVPPAPPEAAAS